MSRLIEDLRRVVGEAGLIADPDLRAVYESDGYTLETAVPDVVVLPATVDELVEVLGVVATHGASLVPRGAGTSLAGGCLADPGAVVVGTSRLRDIEEIDPVNRQALVQAGVANSRISAASKPYGLHFAPDPSSQQVATLGGNIANNSGGPHTLKHGVTVNHVLALELVTPDGRRRWLGSRTPAAGGLDLTGLTVGSEGTFGIVTRAWVRLTPLPEAVRTLCASFRTVDEASRAVSAVIASGIVPAAVELLDAVTLDALRRAFDYRTPDGTGALVIVEVDGPRAGLDREAQRVESACREAGAFTVEEAADDRERARLWSARKQAFAALGRLARNFCTQDGVVPRTRLPEMMRRVAEIAARHELRVANVFHAGDGNLHPILLYDDRVPDEVRRVLEASVEILRACLELGGSLTGEHGIGVEKLAMMTEAFTEDSLAAMADVRRVFDPQGRANPDKTIPGGAGCTDSGALRGNRALSRVLADKQVAQ